MNTNEIITNENSNNITIHTNESLHNQEEKIVVDYWNISDSEFKQRLRAIVEDDLQRKTKIQHWLETDDEVLQFVRQRSCLIANVYSLKMEQDFWKTYHNNTQIEVHWLSKMSETMLKYNNISETFVKTQNYMNKHLKIIESQLQQAIQKLNEHLQEQQQQQVLKLSTIDMSLITPVTIAFVRQDQSQLCKKYEETNSELMLYVNDIRLVEEFYDLKPNNVQVSSFCTLLLS